MVHFYRLLLRSGRGLVLDRARLMRSAVAEAVVDTTVVIPVYFNEQTIAGVVDSVRAAWIAGGRPLASLDFVLVDDGSQDGSWAVLQGLRAQGGEQVTVLRL